MYSFSWLKHGSWRSEDKELVLVFQHVDSSGSQVVGSGLHVLRSLSGASHGTQSSTSFNDEVDLLLSSIPVKSLYCEETSLSCCNLVIRIRSVAASRASITEDAFLPFHSLDSVCIPLQFGPVCSQYRVWGSSVTKLRKHFTCWRSAIHCHRRTHKQSRMFQQWNAQSSYPRHLAFNSSHPFFSPHFSFLLSSLPFSQH